ncbi:hypothetical protein VTJ04DRAFT_8328 [Mycothermus thermophilus]|uniref:uncharacterized protein n=1 Tax=Humicola insolens TaxID=85995 RepID=UPI0037430266
MVKGVIFSRNSMVSNKPYEREMDDMADDLTEDVGDFVPPPLTGKYKEAQSEAWDPFTEFLVNLPTLTDLIYGCSTPVPLCLLQLLHYRHPGCRLHVSTFTLPSTWTDPAADIDPDDFGLLTFPSLHSIRIGAQGTAFTDVMVAHMLLCQWGPRLKHVHISRNTNVTEDGIEPSGTGLGWWKSFFPNVQSSMFKIPEAPSLAQLDTLCLNDEEGEPRHIEAWASCVDFAFLRRFSYRGFITTAFLQTLIKKAADPSHGGAGWFRSLRSLHLNIRQDMEIRREEYPRSTIYDPLVAEFLSLLPPLEHLTIDGEVGVGTIAAILSHHGATLRKLHLPAPFEAFNLSFDSIASLSQKCPRLEDVRLCVNRMKGEIWAYRAVGHLPRLRRAHIVLDCLEEYRTYFLNKGVISLVAIEDHLQPEALDVVRRTTKLFAMDRVLAQEIWDVINEHRTVKYKELRGKALPPLEKLVVGPHVPVPGLLGWRGWGPYYRSLGTWAVWIGRRWECTRADLDHRGVRKRGLRRGVIVHEKPRLEPEFKREGWGAFDLGSLIDFEDENVWDSIWPEGDGREAQDRWHSFPPGTLGEDTGGDSVDKEWAESVFSMY